MKHDLALPNVRSIFVPDPGYVWFEADLKGADAQVVAWEADDEDLKAAFRAGIDVHAKNSEDMLGKEFTSLSLEDPKRKRLRDRNKRCVHAANYLVSPRTLAANAGMLVHDADRFISRWFQLHPKIKEWHRRIEKSLSLTRTVSNAFGYTITYFDRLDQCMTNAVAWIPQSTVALNTTYGAINVEEEPAYYDIFTSQVHDSLIFQLKIEEVAAKLPGIGQRLHIKVPYDDPLTIPWELKMSKVSWGSCKACDWNGRLLH